MNRKILLLILIILIAAVVAVLIFDRPKKEGEILPTNFSEIGNLIRNNPGFVTDAWYLSYEKPGQSGLSVELSFDSESRCNGSTCAVSKFPEGSRVTVQGQKENNRVLVTSLEMIDLTTSDRTVKLYFYNPALDQGPGGVQCSRDGLVAVERVIPRTITPIQDTIKLLLQGDLSTEERQEGITTEFPLPGVSLVSANLASGVLTLELSDPQNRTGGGACRAGILWHQIEATAKQFPEVQSVRFIPEELFQP
jgi:hypothetical protein